MFQFFLQTICKTQSRSGAGASTPATDNQFSKDFLMQNVFVFSRERQRDSVPSCPSCGARVSGYQCAQINKVPWSSRCMLAFNGKFSDV